MFESMKMHEVWLRFQRTVLHKDESVALHECAVALSCIESVTAIDGEMIDGKPVASSQMQMQMRSGEQLRATLTVDEFLETIRVARNGG